jgi:CRP-like cAMP-binding protein
MAGAIPNSHRLLRVYGESQVIFEEGSIGAEMYIVHSGRVKVLRREADLEVVLATLGPGEFFGEMALVDDSPRSATAVAAENDTALLALDKERFLFLVSHQPTFALTIMHILCQRLRPKNTPNGDGNGR